MKKSGFMKIWVWALKISLTHTWLECSITTQTVGKYLMCQTMKEPALT